ncbi:hypothetical protein TREMEDRAFT_40191 [Tremella mesenterica DSM 1558]|uniref:uncharacterized protein n=1 Tax=Tremella mesenterica (strain ATCC 24925 / CBS 8224 / DSM 1558 / NBRC 9311 / NRRL Y-6157 / RJB 2259-6 / UBC 559-6) TaxID=578456 RepID=UPI0003F4A16B|nr:uncharacterized protein TREMEDRAFT_40191 [Tremella mesenterica DSM 1558]EIW68091.1 hypothetical protein TREMEDRAFT_40191 [Tremella mesenterica DSM 1558]
MLRRGKRRVVISSLYIGTEEEELIKSLESLLSSQPHLRMTIILDYHRSTRLSPTSSSNAPSTTHMLLPLVRAYGDRCEVWLYRSPNLRGVMEMIVPERYDEGWGTWHGKWYAVDDEVILSGANLARSYFTNRQDRYIHFRSHPSLLSYLSSLTRLYTNYSYRLSPSLPPSVNKLYSVPLPQPIHSSAALIWPTPSVHPRHFGPHALATLTALQNTWRTSNASRSRRVDADTYVWPVIQAGVLGMREEEKAMELVWDAVRDKGLSPTKRNIQVDLTSGYFALFPAYKKSIINSPAPVRIIAASPRANGFYGSKGFSRLIPEGYTFLERNFWRDCLSAGRVWRDRKEQWEGVRLREWEKEGWTYHSKEQNVKLNKKSTFDPFFTFIGSSNLSTRSLNLDTELSLFISTSSPILHRSLGKELRALNVHARDVNEDTWERKDRKVSFLAKVLVFLGVEGML